MFFLFCSLIYLALVLVQPAVVRYQTHQKVDRWKHAMRTYDRRRQGQAP